MDSYHSPTTKPLFRATQVVWFIMTAIEVLLAFRFALKLMGANPSALFTSFIYNASNIFMFPFSRVFQNETIGNGVIDLNALLAMFVYWVLAIGIIRIFFMGKSVSTPEAAVKLNRQEKI